MTKELKDLRIPIQMSASEVEAIDDWSFENRIRSRSEAIRRLCQLGIITSDHMGAIVDAVMGISVLAEIIRGAPPEIYEKLDAYLSMHSLTQLSTFELDEAQSALFEILEYYSFSTSLLNNSEFTAKISEIREMKKKIKEEKEKNNLFNQEEK